VSSGDAVVIVLVVVLLVVLFSTRVKRPGDGSDGEGRSATWYVNRALVGVAVILVLAAMSDGCEPDKSKPTDATTTTIERVTCTAYYEEDCPPVPAPLPPPPTVVAPPATPNTAGIPDDIPA
jgi:hypothetical protein